MSAVKEKPKEKKGDGGYAFSKFTRKVIPKKYDKSIKTAMLNKENVKKTIRELEEEEKLLKAYGRVKNLPIFKKVITAQEGFVYAIEDM